MLNLFQKGLNTFIKFIGIVYFNICVDIALLIISHMTNGFKIFEYLAVINLNNNLFSYWLII